MRAIGGEVPERLRKDIGTPARYPIPGWRWFAQNLSDSVRR